MNCNHEFKFSLTMIPMWGRLDGKPAHRGDTLNIVGTTFKPGRKCKKCGFTLDN